MTIQRFINWTIWTVVATAVVMSEVKIEAQTVTPLRFPKLPAVSPLGVRNDLSNPFRPGTSWGQLPAGRKWGSTASVTVGPDGKIWAIDRCGASGAGGTTCGGTNIDPIFEFDPATGKLLKNFGAGLFVSPPGSASAGSSMAEGVTADAQGNVYGAEFIMDLKKYFKK